MHSNADQQLPGPATTRQGLPGAWPRHVRADSSPHENWQGFGRVPRACRAVGEGGAAQVEESGKAHAAADPNGVDGSMCQGDRGEPPLSEGLLVAFESAAEVFLQRRGRRPATRLAPAALTLRLAGTP